MVYYFIFHLYRSASPHFSSTSGGVPMSKVITASSRSSSSSAGLVHKPSTCSNLSSAQDPLEYEFNAPIDAISGVVSDLTPTPWLPRIWFTRISLKYVRP